MYQILKRGIMHNHAHSEFYQTKYFFIRKENADKKLEELTAEYKGTSYEEVVDEDEEGNHILDYVFYDIKDCYKIVELEPMDEVIDPLPF